MPVVGYIIGKLDDRKTIGLGFFVTGLSAMMLGSLSCCSRPGTCFCPTSCKAWELVCAWCR